MGDSLRSKLVIRGPLGLSLGDEEAFLTYVKMMFYLNREISELQVQNSLIQYQRNNAIQNSGISESQVQNLLIQYQRNNTIQNRGISESQVQNSLIQYQGNSIVQNRGIIESQVQNSVNPCQENDNTIQVECNNTRKQRGDSKASHLPALKLKIGTWEVSSVTLIYLSYK